MGMDRVQQVGFKLLRLLFASERGFRVPGCRAEELACLRIRISGLRI